MSKPILITNATGNQGSAVLKALVAHPSFDPQTYSILAVTRNAQSSTAQSLASQSPAVKIVEGNLDDVPALFKSALEATKGTPIWGVYSVQISMGKGVTHEGEIRQGKELVNESVKNNVQHFVYSSVDRGGDERSWNNATPILHFQSKHDIELHLRDKAGSKMGWTILRPVAFMENLAMNFQSKVFLALLKNTLGYDNKKLQWVSCNDIGEVAALSFMDPSSWNKKAVGLAGDELSVKELGDRVEKAIGSRLEPTFWPLGSLLGVAVKEMGSMVSWFGEEGYGVDIAKLKQVHPGLRDVESWAKKDSKFQAGG